MFYIYKHLFTLITLFCSLHLRLFKNLNEEHLPMSDISATLMCALCFIEWIYHNLFSLFLLLAIVV